RLASGDEPPAEQDDRLDAEEQRKGLGGPCPADALEMVPDPPRSAPAHGAGNPAGVVLRDEGVDRGEHLLGRRAPHAVAEDRQRHREATHGGPRERGSAPLPPPVPPTGSRGDGERDEEPCPEEDAALLLVAERETSERTAD